MALLSIIAGATREVEEIGAIFKGLGKGLRNRINGERCASALWAPVELIGWLETDAIELEDVPRLGSHKQRQIAELGPVSYGEQGVLWMPSMHGIIRFGPALDVGQVRAALQRQWPGFRQVHLEPFSTDTPLTTSLSRIVNYSNKHRCTTEYADPETGEITPREWETSWLGTYYSWLHGWSRGFHSTRITVKPYTFKVLDIVDHDAEEDIEFDPLPIVYSSSHFDRDYITGVWK